MAKPLYIKASGNKITIICNSKEQEEFVIKSMSTPYCMLDEYEVWEGEQTILTFKVLDYPDVEPLKN
jgi:hypothetical protein|tara:strand:- start:105 stop:305 length:201 start_codon:yes stop_codon:yes gene_type:complete